MANTRLAAIRHSMRLDQEEFAERLGCSVRTVQRWESGTSTRPPMNLIRSLEEVTGQPIERLGFDVLPGADFWADHDAGIIRTPHTPEEVGVLSGIWESRCTYHSGSRGGEGFLDLAHLVVVQSGSKLSAQSIPGSTTDGTTEMQLDLEGHVATGTWRVVTTADSYYQGAPFHGGLQLRVDAIGGTMTGLWVGIGSEDQMNQGPWMLVLHDRSTANAGDYARLPEA